MLNYIRSDLYRLANRISSWIWVAVFLVLPPLLIVGAGSQYDVEKIMTGVSVAIYLLLILAALMLTENVFGEEKRLGLYKNDTTSGISRTKIFISKFLTSAMLEVGLWSLCSVICSFALTKVAGIEEIGRCFTAMFSLQAVWWLLLSVLYVAMFQTIRVLVNKTSTLILAYAIISGVFSQVMSLAEKIVPSLGSLANAADLASMNAFQIVLLFILPFVGISAILAIGCRLFKKSEF